MLQNWEKLRLDILNFEIINVLKEKLQFPNSSKNSAANQFCAESHSLISHSAKPRQFMHLFWGTYSLSSSAVGR